MLGPWFELIDHWDQFSERGNDIVLALLGLLLIAGTSLLLRVFRRWIAWQTAIVVGFPLRDEYRRRSFATHAPMVSASPPLALRI